MFEERVSRITFGLRKEMVALTIMWRKLHSLMVVLYDGIVTLKRTRRRLM
jgi:hypothetical protein